MKHTTRPLIARASAAAALLLFLLCAATFFTPQAHAAAPPTTNGPVFGLKPVKYDPNEPATESYFIFHARPGQTISSQVKITNSGTAPGQAALFSVDGVTAQSTGAINNAQTAPKTDVGAWLNLTASQASLQPAQSQIFSFSFTIPATARPGQHLGFIVAKDVTPKIQPTARAGKNQGVLQLSVVRYSAMAVEVILPGATTEKLTASSISAGGNNNYQQLFITLSNQGNDFLKPYGTLTIYQSGQQIRNYQIAMDTFLPENTIAYPVSVRGQALGAGDYTAMLMLHYGNGHLLHFQTAFSISQQQIAQTFPSTATQLPTLTGSNSSAKLLLAAGAILVFLAVDVLLFLIVLHRRRARAMLPR
jgi:hypothetical protein